MKSRFLLESIIGPRTLETALQLTASVAVYSKDKDPPLILIDDHLPYPRAILQVFGGIKRSHLEEMLQYSIWLWRDLYNWTRIHYSLLDETPAMALCLASEVWTVLKYILYPVHVSDLQRWDWAEQRNNVLESAVDVYKRNKALPVS